MNEYADDLEAVREALDLKDVRPRAKVSQGMLDQFWLWSMQGGLKNSYESIKASLRFCGSYYVLLNRSPSMVLEPILFGPYVRSRCRTRGGTEFSRFLPLATDEGESQSVGGPCVSFFGQLREWGAPHVPIIGTAFSDVGRGSSRKIGVIGIR